MAFATAEPGHQTFAMQQHSHFTQRWMGAKTRFDLAQFDAQAMQLDLEVVAAEKFQLAICPLANQIAAAIQAVTGYERAVDEAFGLHVRQIQVTTGDTRATNVQLTHHALRHRLVIVVQHIQSRVADCAADWQGRFRNRFMRLQGPDAAVHRGFGRTVDVVQTDLWQTQADLCRHGCGQFAAATDDVGQADAMGTFIEIDELLQQRGHELHHADLTVLNFLDQIRRITLTIGTRQYQTNARTQGPE